MKKTIASIFIASVLATSLGTAAFAVEPLPVGFEGGLPTIATSGRDAVTIIGLLTNWLFVLLSIVAVIFIVLAAFQFITAGGSPEAIGQARTKLLYAAIGIVVALIARSIPFVLASIIGAGGAVGGGADGGGVGGFDFEIRVVPNVVKTDDRAIVSFKVTDVGDFDNKLFIYILDCGANSTTGDIENQRVDINDGWQKIADNDESCEYTAEGNSTITVQATFDGDTIQTVTESIEIDDGV